MKLQDWLSRENIRKSAFATDVEVTPGMITGLIDGKYWLSRGLAERIHKRTNGEVTPNDFLNVEEGVVVGDAA